MIQTYAVTERVEISCNATDCERRLVVCFNVDEEVDMWDAERIAMSEGARRGWSRWNNRGVRHYCCDHGPKPGHKLYKTPMQEELPLARLTQIFRFVKETDPR